MSYLPARPLRLKKNFALKQLGNAGLLFAATAALGVGMLVFGAMQARDRMAERALWTEGATPRSAAVKGEVRTKSILGLLPLFHSYRFTVTFEDENGAERSAKYEAESFLEKAVTDREPEVRYDRNDPSRVTVSWIAELGYGRWAWELILFLGGVAIPVAGVQALRAAVRAVQSARACAARSDEIAVKVVSLEKVKGRYGADLGKWRLKYVLPPGPRRRGGERVVVLDGEPIVVPGVGGTRAIGLASNQVPEHPTFPLRDLHPYEASAAQVSALAAALSAPAA